MSIPLKSIYLIAVACVVAFTTNANAGQWAPTEPRSTEQLRNGHDLVIVGKLDRPVRPPTIHDFRIERIGDDGKPAWQPLVFGEDQRGPEARRVKGTVTSVRLQLRPHSTRRLQRAKQADAANRATLSAATSLDSGATYRLTWMPRPADGSDADPITCKFTIVPSEKIDEPDAPVAGPYYVCELLFRDDETGDLFYGRSIVPKRGRQSFGTPAIGFHGKQYLPPPNPGYARLRHAAQEIAVNDDMVALPPPADTTRYYQAVADRTGPTVIAEGDLGTTLPLPKKPGEVRYLVFVSAIYRVQLLDRNVEVLRQDRKLYDDRIGVMMRELAARRDWLDADGVRTGIAAAVMRDAPTLRRLRAEIETYIGLDHPTREQSRAIHWPAQALMRIADPADVALLERLDAKSPDDLRELIDYMRERIADRPKRLRDEAAPKKP